jgi:stalled ribosome alternative rescue factor ArfA
VGALFKRSNCTDFSVYSCFYIVERSVEMVKYVKIKSDIHTQTFLYQLEGSKKGKYSVFRKAVYPNQADLHLYFEDLFIAESKYYAFIDDLTSYLA